MNFEKNGIFAFKERFVISVSKDDDNFRIEVKDTWQYGIELYNIDGGEAMSNVKVAFCKIDDMKSTIEKLKDEFRKEFPTKKNKPPMRDTVLKR
jgi:hypothetical protein